MNTEFVTIIKQLIAEQGKDVFLNAAKCKAFLADYTHNEYKKESRLLLQALEAGVGTAIDRTNELEICKKQQARHLQEDYFLAEDSSAGVVETIALVLEKKEPLRCRKCGKEVQPEWKACPYCGAAQGETPPLRDIPPVTPQAPPMPQPSASSATPQRTTVAPAAAVQTKLAKKKRILRIALIAAAVVIAGIGIRAWYWQSQPAPAMVHINGGTFTMGSPANEAERGSDEKQHQVTVSSFYMGKYEVTQKEWRDVMGNNPSNFKGDDLPVEQVSWYDAVKYCNKLSARKRLTPAYTITGTNVTWNTNANGYRLPTEAEWEYACRAGTSTPFKTGNSITTSQANFNGNYSYNNGTKGAYRGSTWAVGSGTTNAWGLYDMHGNVQEWCWDWYGVYLNAA